MGNGAERALIVAILAIAVIVCAYYLSPAIISICETIGDAVKGVQRK